MNFKQIPYAELSYCLGHERTFGKIQALQDAIDKIKSGAERADVTLRLSFPRVGSTFEAGYTDDNGQVYNVTHQVEEIPFDLWAFKREVMISIKRITAILEHDVPGLHIHVPRPRYESTVRHINDLTDVGPHGIGDINILFVDIPGVSRNANAYQEHGSTLGETTNGGLCITINSKIAWVLDSDPKVYNWPYYKAPDMPMHWSIRGLLEHEFTHEFGALHFPYERFNDDFDNEKRKQYDRILPSITNAQTRPAVSQAYLWPDLFRDVYLRATFAKNYGYSLDHTTIFPNVANEVS